MNIHGVVKAVAEPETRTFERDGDQNAVTRLRVVAESGPLVDKSLDDGRVVKERAYQNFFDVEGWGGAGKALARVNVGEKIHVAGELRQAAPVQREGAETFYPKDTLRVREVDFIGVNKAAGAKLETALNTVDSQVGANMADTGIDQF